MTKTIWLKETPSNCTQSLCCNNSNSFPYYLFFTYLSVRKEKDTYRLLYPIQGKTPEKAKLLQLLKRSQATVKVGRGLWVHIAQHLLEQGHPEQSAHAHVQAASDALQEDFPASLDNPCHYSIIAQKYFLEFRGNFLSSSMCPLPLVWGLCTTEQSLATSSLHPPFSHL